MGYSWGTTGGQHPTYCQTDIGSICFQHLIFGIDLEEFEVHVTDLSSDLPRDLDTTSHQSILNSDEDVRKIYS